MPKLLILSDRAEQYENLIRAAKLPNLEIFAFKNADVKAKIANQCEIVLGYPSLIRDLLPSLAKLRWVQTLSAGVELLLLPSLRRDYVLTNARGVFGELMAEYVFGYLLFHERQIFKHHQLQGKKRWDGSDTGSLRDKTIGLLGVGSIGAHVAKTAKHFGMIVHGYTRSSQSSPDVDVYHHDDLIEFASGVDYLVNIFPNTPETNKLLDASVFDALPKTAIFINVGRGSAVDEKALQAALEQEKIAGAVLDVFDKEPLPKEHPFWTTPNLWITFHTAAPSLPKDISQVFIENYHRYIKDEALNYQVDFERGY